MARIGLFCLIVSLSSSLCDLTEPDLSDLDRDVGENSVEPTIDRFEETVVNSILKIVDAKFDSISTRLGTLERTMSNLQYYNVRQFRIVNIHLRALDTIMQSANAQTVATEVSNNELQTSISYLKTEVKNMEKMQNDLINSINSHFTGLEKRMTGEFDNLQLSLDALKNNTDETKQSVDMTSVAESLTSLMSSNMTDKLISIDNKLDAYHNVTINTFRNVTNDFKTKFDNSYNDSNAERHLLFVTISELNDNVLRSTDFYRHTGDLVERIVGATETVSEDQDIIKEDLRTFLEVQTNQTMCKKEISKEIVDNRIPNDLNVESQQQQTVPKCEISLQKLESLIDNFKNRTDVSDYVADVSHLTGKLLRSSLKDIGDEISSLKEISEALELISKEQLSATPPPSNFLTGSMEYEMETLFNTTKGIFQIVEAIASNTGWIPHIFYNLQYVEGQVNETVLTSRRLVQSTNQATTVVANMWKLIQSRLQTTSPPPTTSSTTTSSTTSTTTTSTTARPTTETTTSLPRTTVSATHGEESQELTYPPMIPNNQSLALLNKVNFIYKTSTKMHRLIPALTRLLGEPEPFITLVDGKNENQGRVEIYKDGRWGSLCANVGHDEASYICRHLGYLGGISAGSGYFGPGEGVFWNINMSCLFSRQCEVAVPVVQSSCNHDNDVAVICDHMIRLRSSEESQRNQRLKAGFVEIHHRGNYVPICADDWSGENSLVVCKQLGFKGGIAVPPDMPNLTYESNQIWLKNITCSGEENRLDACDNITWRRAGCESSGLYVACS